MRIALFHNLPSGGAYRVMNAQSSHLGNIVSCIYTMGPHGSLNRHLTSSMHTYPVKRHKLLKWPFGRVNGLINIWNIQEIAHTSKIVATAIDREDFDVLFVHPCAISQTPPILQYLRTPTVYYCHEPFRAMHEMLLKGGVFTPASDPLRGMYSKIAVANEYHNLRCATTVLSNSYYTREYLLRTYGIDSTVNYPGIDAELFKPSGASRRNRVLSVGRLSPLKGHDFVIESVASINLKHRPGVDIVCGEVDEESRTRLEKLSEVCEVDTQLHTCISDQELVSLYSSALCTCVASVLEPLGLTSLESMACGTPVLAVAEGGIRETVVDGITGYLTQRNRLEFGDRIAYLAENMSIADDLGHAGREWVIKRWSWNTSIEQLTAILGKVARAK